MCPEIRSEISNAFLPARKSSPNVTCFSHQKSQISPKHFKTRFCRHSNPNGSCMFVSVILLWSSLLFSWLSLDCCQVALAWSDVGFDGHQGLCLFSILALESRGIEAYSCDWMSDVQRWCQETQLSERGNPGDKARCFVGRSTPR